MLPVDSLLSLGHDYGWADEHLLDRITVSHLEIVLANHDGK